MPVDQTIMTATLTFVETNLAVQIDSIDSRVRDKVAGSKQEGGSSSSNVAPAIAPVAVSSKKKFKKR